MKTCVIIFLLIDLLNFLTYNQFVIYILITIFRVLHVTVLNFGYLQINNRRGDIYYSEQFISKPNDAPLLLKTG